MTINWSKIVGDTIKYEAGEFDHDETVAFFQTLIDTGYAWKLQGSYGREAQRLIDAGELSPPRRECYAGGC
jgi:hypothetical protein